MSLPLKPCDNPTPPARLYDAHNHLQDERFGGCQPDLLQVCRSLGLGRMVVNGSCESDWPDVARLARQHPEVLPSFGCHPWYVSERSPGWESRLESFLDETPAAIGEIGLDRWKRGLDYAGQEEVFAAQMRIAARRNLPVSIHCLQAWGPLLDQLRRGPRPARGFLLHSYGGPVELVPPLVSLGGYFSFPGYFLHHRKERQRETFKKIPLDRLLVETDAPDQSPPDPSALAGDGASALADAFYPLPPDPHGRPRNHPANLRLVYLGLARIRDIPFAELAALVERNFFRLFGGL